MTTEEASVPVLHDSVLEMLEAEAIFIMREVAADINAAHGVRRRPLPATPSPAGTEGPGAA